MEESQLGDQNTRRNLTFLHLPVDVRARIYRFYFGQSRLIITAWAPNAPPTWWWLTQQFDSGNILLVSRHISKEAKWHLFNSVIFYLDYTFPSLQTALQDLLLIPLYLHQHVQHVWVNSREANISLEGLQELPSLQSIYLAYETYNGMHHCIHDVKSPEGMDLRQTIDWLERNKTRVEELLTRRFMALHTNANNTVVGKIADSVRSVKNAVPNVVTVTADHILRDALITCDLCFLTLQLEITLRFDGQRWIRRQCRLLNVQILFTCSPEEQSSLRNAVYMIWEAMSSDNPLY